MPVFVDTNILLYALDPRDPRKQTAAQEQLTRCWRERSGRVSVQVLNEFYVNALRLLGPLNAARARSEIENLLAWQPAVQDEATMLMAWRVADAIGLSHWDSMIIASAALQGCDVLLSEDMQHGQVIEGVRIVNPFMAD